MGQWQGVSLCWCFTWSVYYHPIVKHVECYFHQMMPHELQCNGRATRRHKIVVRSNVRTDTTEAEAAAAFRSLHTADVTHSEVSDWSPLAFCAYLYKVSFTDSLNKCCVSACLLLVTPYTEPARVRDVSAYDSCFTRWTSAKRKSPMYLRFPHTSRSTLKSAVVASVMCLVCLLSVTSQDFPERRCVCACLLSVTSHAPFLSNTAVSEVSALASPKSFQVLNVSRAQVTDDFTLASCDSLHTLGAGHTLVRDVSPLASCESLHKLDLRFSPISNVSALDVVCLCDTWLCHSNPTGNVRLLEILEVRPAVEVEKDLLS
jgi:hypothetical protein